MSVDNKVKVLFVVGGYLPISIGGTLRVEKIIKYLSKENKVDCKVFAQDLSDSGKYDVINGIEVFRTNTYDLGKSYLKLKSIFKKKRKSIPKDQKKINTSKGRLADNYFVPDIAMLWAFFCCYKLSRVIKRTGIQIVYSSSPNASNHFIVYLARKIFGSKFIWVTEFRDPWITNPFRNKKKAPFEYLDHKLEKAVLKSSDSIIVTSQKYKDEFLEKNEFLSPYKIYYIPNGYDSEDFAFLENVCKRKNHTFTILSAGGYYEKRSLLPFLKAFELALVENPDLENQIQFIHYGTLDVASQIYLQTNTVKGVYIRGEISHQKCLEEMYHADCLLLIPGPGNGTMPGKTFEYLALGIPILALVDEGPSKKLIEDLMAGVVIGIQDVDRLKKALLNFNEELGISVDRKAILSSISKYDRKNIALEVSNVVISSLVKQFKNHLSK